MCCSCFDLAVLRVLYLAPQEDDLDIQDGLIKSQLNVQLQKSVNAICLRFSCLDRTLVHLH